MHIPYFNVPKQERFSNSLMLYFGAMIFGCLAIFFTAGLVGTIFPSIGFVTFPEGATYWRGVSAFAIMALVCAVPTALLYVLAANVHRRGGIFRFR